MLRLKWIWKNMRGKRKYFIIGMVLSVIISMMMVITPKLTQVIIDEVWDGTADEKFFITIVLYQPIPHLSRDFYEYPKNS